MVSKTYPFRADASNYTKAYTGLRQNEPKSSQNSQVLSSENTVTHDGPVPGFRLRLRQGLDCTTNFVGTRHQVDIRKGLAESRQFNPLTGIVSVYHRSGDMCSPSLATFPSGFSESSANSTAISRFISEARSAQTSLQSGVVLGELRETLQMLRNPAMGLRRGFDAYFRSLRKRRKGTKKQKQRALEQTWLEYTFGWTPLIMDIQAAAEVLDRMLYRPEHKYVRGYGQSDGDYSQSSGTYNNGDLSYRIRRRTFNQCIVIYRGTVTLQTFGRAQVGQLLGNPLKLQDFVPTVWELIPFSFVVDYFTNIGDVLSAVSYCESNFRWKNKTVIKEQRIESLATDPSFTPVIAPWQKEKQFFSGGASVATMRTVQRGPHTGSLIPTLGLRVPGMTSLRWLNLAALARTHKSLLPF